MKVQTVVIHFNDGVKTASGFQSVSFTEGKVYEDLHYIVRDGMAVVNYIGADRKRVAVSYPIHDINQVNTVA